MAARGLKGFDAKYESVFGERWPALREALTAPVRQVARLNRFADPKHLEDRFPLPTRERWGGVEWAPCEGSLQPQVDPSGLADCYLMDLASIFPPLALNAQSGDRVLDMCAAPGGKTLVLAETLFGSGKTDGELIANEISDNRRSRLARVVRESVPQSTSGHVKVTGRDAARWCLHERDAFDRILLDAPCSGERHLLEDPNEMKLWSEARSKNLSIRQYALLASALQCTKPGGRIVYSTCALSPRENDDVIARLLKRREGEARVISPRGVGEANAESSKFPPPLGEPTGFGWMILPDTTGFGPIYFCVLERN